MLNHTALYTGFSGVEIMPLILMWSRYKLNLPSIHCHVLVIVYIHEFVIGTFKETWININGRACFIQDFWTVLWFCRHGIFSKSSLSKSHQNTFCFHFLFDANIFWTSTLSKTLKRHSDFALFQLAQGDLTSSLIVFGSTKITFITFGLCQRWTLQFKSIQNTTQ